MVLSLIVQFENRTGDFTSKSDRVKPFQNDRLWERVTSRRGKVAVTVKSVQGYPPPPPQDSINEFILRKLNPLVVVDF